MGDECCDVVKLKTFFLSKKRRAFFLSKKRRGYY
jgi:hypothetical protein